MNNKMYENDIKSEKRNESRIDVEAPPPPYESAGDTPSTSSGVAAYDAKPVDKKIKQSAFNQNEEFSIPKPVHNNHVYSYNDNNSQLQQQQQGNFQQETTTIVYIERDGNRNPNTKKRTCLENYWKPVIDPMAWKSLLYLLLISPVIALFAHIWCGTMLALSFVSLIFPPFGFFFCIGTAWSFRALGRLELITASMCTRKHKPNHMYPPVFRSSFSQTDNGMIRYGIDICLNKHNLMCFLYFVFVNLVYSAFVWGLVLALFILAFSPLMIVTMPLMCITCIQLGQLKVKMSEAILI